MKKYYGNEKILVAATETYCSELRKAGLNITDQAGDDVDCVLCAYDTELTYEKLVQVCKQLTETKVPWFATNPDLRCPIDFGMIPDCGSICRMITASVGREPEYIGKPAPGMVYACLEETGCTPKQTLLIGDRIYTDMECQCRRMEKWFPVPVTGEACRIFFIKITEKVLPKQPDKKISVKNINRKSRRGKEIKCRKSY